MAVLDQLGKQLEESRLRVIACNQAAGFLDQIFHSSDDDGLEQCLFGRKMPVERSDAHARPLGNLVNRRRQASGREDLPGGLHNQFFVALGISAVRDVFRKSQRNGFSRTSRSAMSTRGCSTFATF